MPNEWFIDPKPAGASYLPDLSELPWPTHLLLAGSRSWRPLTLLGWVLTSGLGDEN